MLDTISSRVFHTPELLGIICDNCGDEELARLAQTSEYTFKVVTPRIWNDLKSVQPLLSLLSPTVTLKEDLHEYLDVALPARSPEAFARFDIYCPLVQGLHISNLWETDESKTLSFSVSSWGCLTDRWSLLPNLHRLALSKSYGSDEEILLWLSSFVPLGLQGLAIFSNYGLAPSSVVMALGFLQDKCPRLKRLTMTDFSTAQAAKMLDFPIVLRRLRGLQSLTHLRVHSCFVHPESLATVSCLPKLESFYIVNTLRHYDKLLLVFLGSTVISDDSFPALTTFNVVSHWLDITMTSFQGASQAERPTVIKVRYLLDSDNASPTPKEPVLDHLAFVRAGIKPRLWPMYLGQMPLDWEHPPRIISEDPNWEYMRRFQLVKLGILNSSPDPPFMQESFPPLRSLMYLDMPDQLLTLGQLDYVSQQMPLLCALHSNLVDALDEVPQTQHSSTAQLNKFQLVQPLKNRLEIRSPDQVARFLLSIWPQLRRLDYENEFREGQPGLELLNTYLQAARDSHRNKKE
ncbi:hypothetical protein FRC12_013507 [Ceratobasidium sp. 428]|nr:hypothetical protein FRC12_013507 [Ceratobasidium sp. 428]